MDAEGLRAVQLVTEVKSNLIAFGCTTGRFIESVEPDRVFGNIFYEMGIEPS